MPEVVYHYTSPSAVKGLLTFGQVWASKIQHLNDEREYVQYIDFVQKVAVGNFSKDEADEAAFLDEMLAAVDALRQANVFVTSFTQEGDLLSQWRGYCGAGGYSIGFNFEQLKARLEEQGLNVCEAIYTQPEAANTLPILERAFRNFREHIGDGEGREDRRKAALDPLLSHVVREAPRFKHAGFQEEQEWRVYSGLVERTDDRVDVVDIRGRLRPIIKISLNPHLEEGADRDLGIENCIVSPGPDSALRREALAILLQRQRVLYARVSPSRIPYNPR